MSEGSGQPGAVPPGIGIISLRFGVVRGVVSLGGARLFINLLNAGSILLLARLLTPKDFGVVAIATAVVSVAMSFTDMSFLPALVQCREPTREHVDTVWTMSLIRAACIVTGFALVAWPLAKVYGDPRLLPVLIVSGITGAFMDFCNPRVYVALRDMRFGPLTLFQISQKLVSLSFAIVLAVLFRNYWAIIIGNAAGALASSLLSYVLVPYLPRLTLARVREIWCFSGWMFFNQLCETVNWRFDQLAIGLFTPEAALGKYAVADNLAVIPSRELSMPLTGPIFAGLATISDDLARLRKSYLRAQSTVAFATIPAATGLALTAHPAVHVLLGARWLDCVPLVQVIAIGYAFETLNFAIKPLAMAMGRTKFLFTRSFLFLCLRVPMIVLGLWLGGLYGAALGRLASAFLTSVISLLLVRRLVGLTVFQQVSAHGTTFVGLCAMVATVSLAGASLGEAVAGKPLLHLLMLGGIGAATYLGVTLLLWHSRGRPEGSVSEAVDILRGLLPFLRGARKVEA